MSILKVTDSNIKPLECAKETTPRISVSVWGFTQTTRTSFPSSREVIGQLNTITSYYESSEEQIIDGNKPWMKQPKVSVSVYQLETNYAGVGLSGAPVWEPNRGKIVGMFIAAQGLDPYKDLSTVGYVIPIEVILGAFGPDKKRVVYPSSNIDTASFIRNGNDDLSEQNYEKAIESYNVIINDPNYFNALNNKATALDELERYEEALKCYDISITVHEDSEDTWYNKGLLLHKLERYDEALKCYDKALELNPNFPYAWNNHGSIIADSGNYEEALKFFDKFIEIDPNYANVWYNKGVCFAGLEKYQDALKFFDKALELDPDYASAWDAKGEALRHLKYEAAERCLSRARELTLMHKKTKNIYPVHKGRA